MGRLSVNLYYVVFWGVISFISSFEHLFYVNWFSYVEPEMLLKTLNILFLWIVAFLGEFIYNFSTYDRSTHMVNERLIIVLLGLLEILFIVFWAFLRFRNIFLIIAIYLCVMGMKTVSLHIICPFKRIKSI